MHLKNKVQYDSQNKLHLQWVFFFSLGFLILTSCQSLRPSSVSQRPMTKPNENSSAPSRRESVKDSTGKITNESLLEVSDVLNSVENEKNQSVVQEIQKNENPTRVNTNQLILNDKSPPSFGVILIGAGARSWGYAGVLKNFDKFKFPIRAIVGYEWASPLAALYAINGHAQIIEWELQKFEKLKEWENFVDKVFLSTHTRNNKINFMCPSLNLFQEQVYLLNQGQYRDFIKYCMAMGPYLKPYKNSLAHLSDLELTMQYLKKLKVDKIIVVNALASKVSFNESLDFSNGYNAIWGQYAASVRRNKPIFDEIIELDLGFHQIDKFENLRDLIVKSENLSYTAVNKLAQKYRLD